MCNCGSGKKRQFEHTAPNGQVTIVQSQAEAISLTRKQGGVWRLKTS